ncbi:T9SS type A sorting domain-containing protein [Flammeovirga pectinis]|uniref:T9SS type A sorting domain-containing protein n=1 Tax=Flammeovirga pectinis TaxID=2494373 RepID=A0A3Q9FIZ7_9BACT|nr:T9SS type A sorting domain-containing protein [Flammeovirga pectinis]AZQ60897.1 T9SS type A sorting domain-containing protein [Flammeovirga pectinis]
MKRLFLLSLFINIHFALFGQPSTEWAQFAETTLSTNAYGTFNTTDNSGNTYNVGYYGTSSGETFVAGSESISAEEGIGYDGFIIKYDTDGVVLWMESLGGKDSHDYIRSIKTDGSGNIYLVGYYEDSANFDGANTITTSGQQDTFIVKYNSSGVFQWVKEIKGTSSIKGESVTIDTSGNIVVTGSYAAGTISCEGLSISGSTQSLFVAKFDSDGTATWIGSIEYYATIGAKSLSTDSNDNIYITGSINTSQSKIKTATDGVSNDYSDTNITLTDFTSGSSDIFITKFNYDGELQWFKSTTNTGTASGNGIIVDSNDNFYITGYYNGTINTVNTSNDNDAFIAKYNSAGTLIWLESYGGSGDQSGVATVVDQLDDVYLTTDNTIVKLDSDGNQEWTRSSSSPTGTLETQSISINSGGDIIISGQFKEDADFNGTSIDAERSAWSIFTTKFSNSDDLPIELLSFTGSLENNQVLFTWETASEINNDFFTLERSKDGKNWQIIETIKGAGNSSTTLKYTTVDTTPFSKKSYYRLKQTDFDRQYTYSNSISIQKESTNEFILSYYPNPSRNTLTIEHNASQDINYQIINALGQIELRGTLLQQNDVINLSNLKSGLHYLKTYKKTVKIIVAKD